MCYCITRKGYKALNDKNVRFIELRKALNMSQEEIGKIIGIKRSGVSKIESGLREVSEKHIKFLCLSPINGRYVSEAWLRTGNGEMFLPLPEEDETATYISLLLEDSHNPFADIVINIMKTYAELSPKSQEALHEFCQKLKKNLTEKQEED